MHQVVFLCFFQCGNKSGREFLCKVRTLLGNRRKKLLLQGFEAAQGSPILQVTGFILTNVLKGGFCIGHKRTVFCIVSINRQFQKYTWKSEFREAVSQILLFVRLTVRIVIHLSINASIDSPDGGCGVPETIGRATRFPISPCIGLGLHCPLGRPSGGGLLPHHFNLTFNRGRYVFCCTCRELALTQVPPDFTGNPALRCPDFPLLPRLQEQRMTASRKLDEVSALRN